MPSVGILGLGHGLPGKVLSNKDLESVVETSDQWVRERTGIRERRIAAPEQCASHLGTEAALQALADAKLDPDQLDLIICATLTPDTPMPCTACRIAHEIGATRAGAFDLSIACSGFAYGLTVAQQFVANGNARHILVIGAETLSRVTNYTDRSTCVLFGDGAAAAVVGQCPDGYGILGFHFGADGSGTELLNIPGGAGIPLRGPHDHTIYMAGKGVFRFAIQAMGEACSRALENAGIPVQEVSLFVPHQANQRIIEAASRRLGVSMDRVYMNIERYGNTSSASVPLALYEARDEGRIHPGDVVVTVGFGGGLAWSALVIRWS